MPSPALQFAYDMAFDRRFEALRWSEVETKLAAEYAGWLERNQAGSVPTPWDHDAWDHLPHRRRSA